MTIRGSAQATASAQVTSLRQHQMTNPPVNRLALPRGVAPPGGGFFARDKIATKFHTQ
jgi:hypothetical protein